MVLTHLVPIWKLQVRKWLKTLGLTLVTQLNNIIYNNKNVCKSTWTFWIKCSSRMHIIKLELETLDFSLNLFSMNFTSKRSSTYWLCTSCLLLLRYYRPFQSWLPYWFNGWAFTFFYSSFLLRAACNDLYMNIPSWSLLMLSVYRWHGGQLCSRSLHRHYRYAFRSHQSTLKRYAHMSNQFCYLSRSHGTWFSGRVNRLVCLYAQ